jgi:ATP-dependent HslUV protease ATP-binding subunit HslU
MPVMEMFAGAGMGEMDQNLRDMLGNMLPTRTKLRKVRVSEARRLLIQEETQKLIDVDEVASQAIRRSSLMPPTFVTSGCTMSKAPAWSHG